MKKEAEKRIEIKVEDGVISLKITGFSDFETIGILSYYQDVLKVNKIQTENTSTAVS